MPRAEYLTEVPYFRKSDIGFRFVSIENSEYILTSRSYLHHWDVTYMWPPCGIQKLNRYSVYT